MRTFKVLEKTTTLAPEFISVGVEYTLNQITDTVYYCRNQTEVSCSCMPTYKFKKALREGSIVFTD